MTEIADITNDLLGMAFYGKGDDRSTMTYMFNSPNSRDGTQSVAWSSWRRNGLAISLQPTDLYILWDFSGTDPSLYKMTMLVYDNVMYRSMEEFREAYEWGEVERRPLLPTDESWIRKNRKGSPREMEDRMAPTITETEGKRYKVDNDNKYIEYMGWSFYTRFDRDVGIQFYNVKFKEEQIMYELSMQGMWFTTRILVSHALTSIGRRCNFAVLGRQPLPSQHRLLGPLHLHGRAYGPPHAGIRLPIPRDILGLYVQRGDKSGNPQEHNLYIRDRYWCAHHAAHRPDVFTVHEGVKTSCSANYHSGKL